MAVFRKVHIEFWKDPKVLEEMTPEDKYFMLYLLTNPNTTQIGIYQISKKTMAFELGYSMESVTSLMDRFINNHKIIKYNKETREIAIKNWGRYNLDRAGKPMEDCVKSQLKEVKDLTFIKYVGEEVQSASLKALYDKYTIRGACSTQEEEKEKEEEEEEEREEDIEIEKEIKEEEEEVGTRLSKGFKDEVLKTWNDINSMDNNFSKIRTISDKRAKKLRSLAKKYSEEEILKAINLIKRSSFLRGKNERGWSADVDWFLIENNFLKILEGKYTDKKSNKVMALERQEEKEKEKEEDADYQRMKDILRKRKGLI